MANASKARWNFSNVVKAEQELRVAIEATTEPESRAELMTQLGRARGLQGDFEQALHWIDAAGEMSQSPRVRVFVDMERGRVLNTSGKPAEALPLFESAFQLAQLHAEFELAADAAHMVAIVSPYPKALEWTEIGLGIAAASDDPQVKRWRGPLLNNIGWAAFEGRDFETALGFFQQSLAVREENPSAQVPIRIAKYSVAKALRQLHRVEEAITILRAIVVESDSEGNPDGYFLAELAFALGPDHEETESLVQRALQHLPASEIQLRADLSDF